MANEPTWAIAEDYFQGAPLHELIDTYGADEVCAALVANELLDEGTTEEELLSMREPLEWRTPS